MRTNQTIDFKQIVKSTNLHRRYKLTHVVTSGDKKTHPHVVKELLKGNYKLFRDDVKGKMQLERHCWKPYGVWVSVNHGWEDWCRAEDFINIDRATILDVKLKPNLRLLKIKTERDLYTWMEVMSKSPRDNVPQSFLDIRDKNNFQHMYDAMWVAFNGKDIWKWCYENCDGVWFMNSDYMHFQTFFNTWDVDSMVIFNPKNVIFSNPRLGKNDK